MCTVLLMDRRLRKCLGERISVCECDSMTKVARRRWGKVVCVWSVCGGVVYYRGKQNDGVLGILLLVHWLLDTFNSTAASTVKTCLRHVTP